MGIRRLQPAYFDVSKTSGIRRNVPLLPLGGAQMGQEEMICINRDSLICSR